MAIRIFFVMQNDPYRLLEASSAVSSEKRMDESFTRPFLQEKKITPLECLGWKGVSSIS